MASNIIMELGLSTAPQGAPKKNDVGNFIKSTWQNILQFGHSTYVKLDTYTKIASRLEKKVAIGAFCLFAAGTTVILLSLVNPAFALVNPYIKSLLLLVEGVSASIGALFVTKPLLRFFYRATNQIYTITLTDLSEMDEWRPRIGNVTAKKVTKTKEAVQVAKIAHDVFGDPSVKERSELFAVWQRKCRDGMYLIYEDKEVVGYVLCLAVDSVADLHMAGKLSQFDIRGEHLKRLSNHVYIQAVYINSQYSKRNPALQRMLLKVLVRAVKSLMDRNEKELTIYFEEYSERAAKWAQRLGFNELKNKSVNDHTIWAITINPKSKNPPPLQRLVHWGLRE